MLAADGFICTGLSGRLSLPACRCSHHGTHPPVARSSHTPRVGLLGTIFKRPRHIIHAVALVQMSQSSEQLHGRRGGQGESLSTVKSLEIVHPNALAAGTYGEHLPPSTKKPRKHL